MRLRASNSPAGPGRGLAIPQLAARVPTPAQLFGSSLAFEALASRATLSGANITALSNVVGGTAGPMSSGVVSCVLDSTVLQGTLAAIRTSPLSAQLRILSGAPTGSGSHYQWALASIVSQRGAGQQDSSFMQLGAPGNDGTHKQVGVGAVAASNGAWLRAGGFGNPLAQGGAIPRMAYDARVHLYEVIYDSVANVTSCYRDLIFLGSAAGAVSIPGTGEWGFQWGYPLPAYSAPDARIYNAGVIGRLPTLAERSALGAYVKHLAAYQPEMFVQVIGDSITAGHVGGANTTSYIEQAQLQWATVGRTVAINNTGVSSQATDAILARMTPTYLAALGPPGFGVRWIIIGGGTNDASAGISASQTIANLQAMTTLAKAAGFSVAVMTMIPEAVMTSTDIANWTTINNGIVAIAGADKVIDLRPLLAVPATTGLAADNAHPTDATTAAMGAVVVATLP